MVRYIREICGNDEIRMMRGKMRMIEREKKGVIVGKRKGCRGRWVVDMILRL